MKRYIYVFGICINFLLVVGNLYGDNASPARALTYEERLQCIKAVEQVNWQYRIWPKENTGSKPAFAHVMSDEALRNLVTPH